MYNCLVIYTRDIKSPYCITKLVSNNNYFISKIIVLTTKPFTGTEFFASQHADVINKLCKSFLHYSLQSTKFPANKFFELGTVH